MLVVQVSVDGDSPVDRAIESRTHNLIPGVLCEVWSDEGMRLCVVERIDEDGCVAVRRLPCPPVDPSRTSKQHWKTRSINSRS
jgi:hypothetical protein